EQGVRIAGGDYVASLVFPEEGGRREGHAIVEQRAAASGQRHFGQSDEQPAVGNVVDRRDQTGGDRLAHRFAMAALGGEVDRRRRAVFPAGELAEPERLAELPGAVAEQSDVVAVRLEGDGCARLPISKRPDAADRRRGEAGGVAAFRLDLVLG